MIKKVLSVFIVPAMLLCLGGCGYSVDMSVFKDKDGNTGANIAQGGFSARNGKYVYYTVNNKLYEMDMENKQTICIPNINPLFGYLNVIDSYLICTAVDADNLGKAGRMILFSLDGSFTKVLDKSPYVPILVSNGQIFATTARGGWLYKWNADGSGKTLLTKDSVEEFYVTKNAIYYLCESKIKRIKLDGSEKSDILPLVSTGTFCIDEDAGYVYFRNLEDGGKIYRADLNDGTIIKAVDSSCLYFQKRGNDIFFINFNREFYNVSINENIFEPTLVMKDISQFNIFDDIIMMVSSDQNVYIMDSKKTIKQLTVEEPS